MANRGVFLGSSLVCTVDELTFATGRDLSTGMATPPILTLASPRLSAEFTLAAKDEDEFWGAF